MSPPYDAIARDLRRARGQLARGDNPMRVMDVLSMRIAGQIAQTDARFDWPAFAETSGVPRDGPPRHLVSGEPL